MSNARNHICKKLDSDKLHKDINPKIKAMINQVFKEDHDLINALKYL